MFAHSVRIVYFVAPNMRTVLLKSYHWQKQRHFETKNKPRTAKVGAISKAQNLKRGPFGLCETPAGCKKFEKKMKGSPLET